MSKDVLGQAQRLAAGLWDCDLCRFCVNGSTQGNEALALSVARPGDRGGRLAEHAQVGASRVSCSPGSTRSGCGPTSTRRRACRSACRPSGCGCARPPPGRSRRVPRGAVVRRRALGRRGDRRASARPWDPARRGPGLGRALRLPSGSAAVDAHARRGRNGHVGAQDARRRSRRARTCSRAAGLLDLDRLGEAFEALHTTSPSGRMLASLDYARWVMAQRGEELLGRTIELAGTVAGGARGRRRAYGSSRATTRRSSCSRWAERARTGSRSRPTSSHRACASSWRTATRSSRSSRSATRAESAERLVDLLGRAIERHRGEPARAGRGHGGVVGRARGRHLPREAFFAPRETVAASTADGRIAAEMVVPYPPGIPAIAPGEVVRAPLVGALQEAAAEGTRIAYCADPKLETIQVVARS